MGSDEREQPADPGPGSRGGDAGAQQSAAQSSSDQAAMPAPAQPGAGANPAQAGKGNGAAASGQAKPMPRGFFWLELFYLLVLGGVFYLYHQSAGFRDDFPNVGPLPMAVLWFGALGGVMVGMSGIYFHNRQWDDGYNYWHLSRPFMGAAAGGIGALLFYATILLGNNQAPTPNHVAFEAVAFIFGFADDAFRAMIKKVTDLLGPAATPADSPGGNPQEQPPGKTQ